jgi:hypothetical protein
VIERDTMTYMLRVRWDNGQTRSMHEMYVSPSRVPAPAVPARPGACPEHGALTPDGWCVECLTSALTEIYQSGMCSSAIVEAGMSQTAAAALGITDPCAPQPVPHASRR